MTSSSTPAVMIEAVVKCLRDVVLPQTSGAVAFNIRVSANALDLVVRELLLKPNSEIAERGRLKVLLGVDCGLEEMRAELCDRIAAGQLQDSSKALRDHLWATVLAQLAVDQPSYSTYRKALDANKTSSTQGAAP